MNEFYTPEKPIETEPKPLFKLILMRHQETDYTEEGHDLTDRGIEGAKETGREMKTDTFFSPEEKVALFHSPKPRAKATLDFVSEEAGFQDEGRAVKVLGSSKILDMKAFESHIEELEDDLARIAEAHYIHDFHQNHPELIEPHAKKKERLYRAMEYFIRAAVKNEDTQPGQTAQALAVSHFEILTHLVNDVFDIKNTGYRSPLMGEQIKIIGFQTEDPEVIILEVEFRDFQKKVTFNRKTRSIEPYSTI